MGKKSSQQRKKDAKQTRAKVAAKLEVLEAATEAVSKSLGEVAETAAAPEAPVRIQEEEALGEVGERFDARATDTFGTEADIAAAAAAAAAAALEDDVRDAASVDDDEGEGDATKPDGVSKKRLRKQLAIDPAVLKDLVPDPTKVEFHDANAPDPVFLVRLKCQRFSLPVPRHWIKKSLFLKDQKQRDGGEELVPAFISKTGVAAMRPATAPVDVKALAIPFVAGHPRLPITDFGDVYYEYKDMRARFRRFKPGAMSQRLRDALGMTALNAPPPWLQGMQRVARLPPSYPTLKIPGLNAPLPKGARWGPSKGEWGQPVRDPNTNALVFPSVLQEQFDEEVADPTAESYWGTAPADQAVVKISTGPKARPAAAPQTAASGPQAPAGPAIPKFVPQPGMLPQHMQYQGQQVPIGSVELQRVHAGYQGGGMMPSSHVYVEAGAGPRGGVPQQQQPPQPYQGYGAAGVPPAMPGFGQTAVPGSAVPDDDRLNRL